MLKRSPSLVQQVKAHLKKRVINGEFEGGRILPETDLATEMGVSRNTVRDALSQLEVEGVVFRKQGAGTFVNEARLLVKTRLEEIIPYRDMIREHGFVPDIRLISINEEPAGPEIAAILNLAPDTTLLVVQKLFLADNQPVIFTPYANPPRHNRTTLYAG